MRFYFTISHTSTLRLGFLPNVIIGFKDTQSKILPNYAAKKHSDWCKHELDI